MLSTIRERRQKVSDYLKNHTKQGIEAIAKTLGISKSSVHRHQQAIAKGDQYPESGWWDSEIGHQWLIRLVVGVIYHFGIKQGIGSDSLSAFFRELHLETHVGISASALRQLEQRMSQAIIAYEQAQAADCQGAGNQGICLGADETFFGLPILVLIELSSGFIFTEVACENRCYDTWLKQLKQWWQPEQWHCHFLVSDCARALVKLAVSGLASVSVSDLFHAMRALGRPIGTELGRQLAKVKRKMDKLEQQLSATPDGKKHQSCQAQLNSLTQAQQQLEADQRTYHQALAAISQTIHPFTLDASDGQLPKELTERLSQPLATLKHLGQTYATDTAAAAIATFEGQINSWANGIQAWWQWTEQSLQAQTQDIAVQNWVLSILLPWVYWSQQADKARHPQSQVRYQQAASDAFDALVTHPLTGQWTDEQLQQWKHWAQQRAECYQRTSSAVKGRNGYLSQRHHVTRGFSPDSLKVLTIIHNFDLTRPDGTTAAQRLFGKPFPNLFDSVLNQIHDLPMPRRSENTHLPKPPH